MEETSRVYCEVVWNRPETDRSTEFRGVSEGRVRPQEESEPRTVRERYESIYPLSPMQQGVLFHCLDEPEAPVYVEQIRLTLDGLDPASLRRSWKLAFERHAALRTSILGTRLEEPVQVVHHAVDLPWTELDWRSEGDTTAALERFLASDAQRGFELDRAPLTRLTLIRTGPETYELVWTLHHIILDGWSGGLVVRDVLRAYADLVEGREPALPAPRPFRDHVAWLRAQDLAAAESFWRAKLAGFEAPSRVELPGPPVPHEPRGETPGETRAGCEPDRARPASIQDYGLATRRLTAADCGELRAGAARCEVTLNTLAQAAWARLVALHSGTDDVVYGSVEAGRPEELAGVHEMVGMFVNTLPQRIAVPETQSVREWLQAIQRDQSEQRRFTYSPLWRIQQWSPLPAGTPLFDNLLVFENYPADVPERPGDGRLRVRATPPFDRTGYPLMLLVVPGEGLELRLTYDAGGIDAAAAERFLDHFVRLAQALVREPSARAADVTALDSGERRRVLTEFNRTAAALPVRCLHPLFEDEVDRDPTATAILASDGALSYGELEERANRLAAHLIAQGVRPGERVGLCLERSAEVVVAVLATLKAGAGYVPLDPTYPDRRLEHVLADAGLRAVVVHAATARRLSWPASATVVDLDEHAQRIDAASAERPNLDLSPSGPLYVLYTSGSTGRPKGVVMPHAPLANLVQWQRSASDAGPGWRTLQFAPLGFDVSCQELFTTLATGGTLCLIDDDARRDPERLLAWVREQRVERLFLPFVALEQLASSAVAAGAFPESLREVVTAGEQLRITPALREFFTHLPACRLANQYGPTECHVVSALALEGPAAGWPALPSIGRPVANAALLVLDAGRRPVPVGVPGELYIGGAPLADGYLGDAQRTAERFVPNPFAAELTEAGLESPRLYRTGDRARLLEDGSVEFLGRVDDQVKLRGFRVELGEVESVLAEHERVEQAVALVREDRPGDRRLVVYVTPASGAAAEELRSFARERLPDYMVPAAVVFLAALPTTPSGKVDRRALLAAEHAPTESRGAFAPARGPVEEALVEIWSDVLGVRDLGIHDSFFELGGHSLTATRVVARVREALRVELPVRALFEHPTVAGLASVLGAAKGEEAAARGRVIPASEDDSSAPLSHQQRRLWIANALGDGATYNMPWAFRLTGELDVAALERALTGVVGRHAVLRTRLPAADAGGREPRQAIADVSEFGLETGDWASFAAEEQERRIRERLEFESRHPFDLAEDLPFRAALLRLGDRESLLLLTFHHVAFDGWSQAVFYRELGALYTGNDARLPALDVQYADYARWQAGRSEEEDRALEHWKERLADLPTLALPTRAPRPRVRSHRGATHAFELSPELTHALKLLARRRGATLAMTLTAGFKALLARWTGETDIVVGAPVANRERREVENLIGFFVNNLVLRTDLGGDPSFAEVLERVKATALDAYEHQELPYEKLVDALVCDRDPALNPLFQVAVVVQNAPAGELELPGVSVEAVSGGAGAARFDLELFGAERDGRLRASLCYDVELFDAEAIEGLAAAFEVLLQGAAADPGRSLSTLPLLGPAGREQLARWNATGEDWDLERTLPALFEEQVARTPTAEAVVFEEEVLTYAELDERAGRIAGALRRRGVGPGRLVGVCLERGADLVAALVAVGKAGAAWVPLDPELPDERLAFMTEDAELAAVLTHRGLAREPWSHLALHLDDADALAADAPPRSEPPATADDLAYVLFTSGSTGRPKGAMVHHRAIVNRILWMQAAFGLTPADRVLQKTPFSFDVSVWEFFWPLTSGATLVVARPGGHRDPEYLAELIASRGVTTAHFVPSMLRAFLEGAPVAELRSLRRVIASGEELTRDLQDRFFARCGAELHNLYGPTETAVDVTAWKCRADDDAARVPIGRPIANTTAHVVDAALEPVPPGFPGELVIGGVQVGRGYLGRPELTEASFVPDPSSPDAGARLYRTGDLARFRSDGNLEFLGRIDQQVKLRGHRIELGEVESVLRAHARVDDVAAVVRELGDGNRRLVAYVVARPGASPSSEELRSHCARSLPEVMVPSEFATLDALPRTSSGKLDRRALPAPERPVAGAELEAPRTEAERTLARIWESVLGREGVGVHESFFRLGGDSILGLQMVARAKAAGLELRPRHVFEHRTIAELALVAAGSGGAVREERGPVTGDVPLTPIQHWFHEQELAEAHHFNHVALLDVLRPLNAEVCERALRELVVHHDVLRTRCLRGRHGWRHVQDGPELDVSLLRVDLSSCGAEELDGALAAEIARLQAALDLRNGPLFRFALVHAPGESPDRLVLVLHHLVVDVVSWRILLEDLETLCSQLSRGEEPRLPAKTTSLRDWARAAVDRAQSEAAARELQFWTGLPWSELVPLPRDDESAENPAGRARTVEVALDADETRVFLEDVGVTSDTRADELLLAALVDSVASWTGASSVGVNLEGHGREDLFDGCDLSRTVGWFTALAPAVLRAGATLEETLRAVKRDLRALPGWGAGFGRLRYLSADEAVYGPLESLPTPEISFNHIGRADRGGRGARAEDSSGWFAPAADAAERIGPLQGATNRRAHLLDVMTAVVGGELRLRIEFGADVHRRETVEGLANGVLDSLRTSLRAAAEAREAARQTYPLSPMQLGMMVHALDGAGTGVYVQQMHYEARGLDPAAFREAWEEVVARHAVLRTSLEVGGDGEPWQTVHGSAALEFTEHDVSGLQGGEREAFFAQLLAADRERGFDLGTAPLSRVNLVDLGGGRHRFLWTFHHIVLDGWSWPIVLSEVLRLHAARARGEELELPAARPYRDYIEWLGSRDVSAAEAFWRDELAGFTEPTRVDPRPRRQGSAPTAGAREVRLEWTESETSGLERLAESRGVTLNTLTLGAWALLLGRTLGTEDLVVGTTVAGRPADLEGIESMVGLFINTLAQRVRIANEATLGEWLRDLQARQLEAREFEFTPLDRVQRWSELPPATPLFDCLFLFESFPTPSGDAASGLDLRYLPEPQRTGYPLSLALAPRGGLLGRLTYDTSAFGADEIERLGERYRRLLASLARVAGDAEVRLEELTALTEEERTRVLVDWNRPRVAAEPATRPLHETFRAWARRTPDAPAVAFEDERLDHRELDRRSDRLARELLASGLEPGGRVALCLGRSLELPLAMLATWKAGGAWVPLDPEHPVRRLNGILADCEASVLVSAGDLPEGVHFEGRIVRLDELDGTSGSDTALPSVDLDALAYLVYTSGSTGEPKGVAVEHAQVASYTAAVRAALELPDGCRYATVSTPAADLGNTAIFAAMASGGELFVLSEDRIADGDAFAEYVAREQIDCIKIVPSHLRALLAAAARPADVLPRRLLVLGGEALSWSLVDRVRELAPACALLNHYGPTETTVGVVTHRLGAEDRERYPAQPPIGRPLFGTRVYLLDRRGAPVPPGSAGELCVAGAQVARGYWRRDALTAARFGVDPFEPAPAEATRLYRTGDLARHHADGALEFLGRVDDQVKIRGFRVELGEVERAVSELPDVEGCLVLARPDGRGEPQLVAWVAAARGGDPAAWRTRLAETLPDALLPRAFVVLDELPLDATGKVDRRALPEPSWSERSSGGRTTAETPAEEALLEIWREVLRVPGLGIDDDYFALGGDSILGIQIVSRARRAGLQLKPRLLFQHPTVAELAAAAAKDTPEVAHGPRTGRVPLTPIQERFFEWDPVEPHLYQYVELLELAVELPREALERAARALLDHHDALRTRFARGADGWAQEIPESRDADLEDVLRRVDLRAVSEASLSAVLDDEVQRASESLELDGGALVRIVHLATAGDEPDRLFLAVHHLVVDAVSWAIVLEDLVRLCEAATEGRAVELPPATSPFRDWAERLQRYAWSTELADEVDVWATDEDVPPLAADLDAPAEANTVGNVETTTFTLDAAETEAFLREAPRTTRAQPQELLLAALGRALCRWSGAERVRVDVEGHGRSGPFDDLDLSRTVGWFTTVRPVTLASADALGRAKEELRRAPHDGIGYGVLRYLGPAEHAERLRALAPADVGFNYFGQLDLEGPSSELVARSRQSAGPGMSPRQVRRYALEVRGAVRDGRLGMTFLGSSALHRAESVQAIADGFGQALRELIGSRDRTSWSPSDFPLARLGQDELERLVARLGPERVEDVYPLTGLQQGMVYHTLTGGGGEAYVSQLGFTLVGELDAGAMRAAWEDVVAAHPILRTVCVVSGEEELHQAVLRSVELEFEVVDWSGLDAAERDARLAALEEEQRTRGFDLEVAPLMRFHLVRTGGDRHRLVWTHHHVLLDGWSLARLLDDAFRAYYARAAGRAADLQPGRPFADYLRWLQGQNEARAAAWWRARLADWDEPTPLPARAAESAPAAEDEARTGRAAHTLTLDRARSDALREFARANRLTTNTVVLGAWVQLLSRLGGREEVLFGLTVSGRPAELAGVERMVGLFINTLPLRVDASPAELVPWLRSLQDEQLELQQFAHVPLYELQRLSRVPAGVDLFESLFVFENYPAPRTEAEGVPAAAALRVEAPEDVSFVNYPLALVVRAADEVHLEARYDRERLDDAQVKRLLEQLARLLDGMPAASTTEDLSLIDEAERERVLEQWNDTRTAYPSESTIHELFAEQAASSPDAPALLVDGAVVTYGELDRRANRLAHHLRALGVRAESRVALCVPRGADQVVGVLAILKAGGAYVPLDPSYPAQRLAFMLADTAAEVLVTTRDQRASLPEFAGDVLVLEEAAAAIAGRPDVAPSVEATASSLAYVMYTSGSTGTPKGIGVEHRNVVRLVRGTNYVELGPDEVFLQFAPISFDASTFELWGSLLNGARLVLPPPGPLSMQELGRTLVRERVSVLWLTGALFRQMVDEELEALRGVRQVLAGGEALSVPHVRAMLDALAPGARLVNGYGPTENTTFTCCHVMRSGDRVGDSVPIGKPIANTRVYLLDARLRPVPAGVPGRLFAAGDGVARGYLGRSELTAERFLPDPFVQGARMYDTGDLARLLPDGSIEFLGRRDAQVKVRGFRIEPGEVEAALSDLPSVRDAVVVCSEEGDERRLVAYVVPADGATVDSSAWAAALEERLPPYMVPAAFVALAELPVTPNGKLDHAALPAPDWGAAGAAEFVAPRGEIEERIAKIWREVLGLDEVGIHDNFFDVGGHSLLLLRVHSRLTAEFDCADELDVTDLFDYPTIESLADFFGGDTESAGSLRETAEARLAESRATGSVAVVGMSGRFPGAPDVDALWENLRKGVESIRHFTDEELRRSGVSESVLSHPDYVKARAVVDDTDLFDAGFFGYSPRECEFIDPQHRVFLECAWEALERSGCDPNRYAGLIGVYGGASINTYVDNLKSRPDLVSALGDMQSIMSSDRDYLTTRVSYKLNLRGPSFNLQTACSTSLVAIVQACRSLLDRQCDMALAGGVSITYPQELGYTFTEAGIRSPDAHNRTFDARAQGTVSGQGAAVVALKRLEDARADGDPILAVILGTGLNNDGSDKVGFTAPSIEGQAAAIAMAHAAAGVDPETIGYVEAHGTGTALGDPIEVAALTRVFRERTRRREFCALGSIKSNMGHLNEAAGAAGFIKTVLSLQHRQLAPSLHFEQPNPAIDFAASPFFVNAKLREWAAVDDTPRRAGVSSFGLGGTNAHVVLEEAVGVATEAPSRAWQVLPLSARSPKALDEAAGNLAQYLLRNPDVQLADVAWTLQTGRSEFEHRRAVWCRSVSEAVEALRGKLPSRVTQARALAGGRSTVFLLPGHGHQYADMGRGLYESEPVFREAVDECVGLVQDELEVDLLGAIFPDGDPERAAETLLSEPVVFQPAIFTIEYALARLWRSWGIEPDACIGHSLGEYVAACLSGVLRLEDALRLVVLRGRLMEAAPEGAMLSIVHPADEVRRWVAEEPGLWVCVHNAPELTLIGGESERLEAFESKLTERDVEFQRLRSTRAYHSGMMDDGVSPLTEAVRPLSLSAPRIPYISNLTGDWITEAEVRDPGMWGRHLAGTVRFSEGMARVLEDERAALLEVGPGQVVSSLARLQPACGVDRPIVASTRHPSGEEDDVELAMGAVAKLWCAGVRPDWAGFHSHERRARLTLPTYPFQRQRYWIERAKDWIPGATAGPRRKSDLADWFYAPTWRRAAAPEGRRAQRVLVFADATPFSTELTEALRERSTVTAVRPGPAFARTEEGFSIDPRDGAGYRELLRALAADGATPERIVHAWTADPDLDDESTRALGFTSLFHLARAVSECELTDPLRIVVVGEGVHEVTGDETLRPEAATVLGPCRVLGIEFPNLDCRSVDLLAADLRGLEERWLASVANEVLADSDDAAVALRGARRWVESFTPVRIPEPEREMAGLREGGTYLVTGGFTGVGFVLAEFLARRAKAKLVITGRTELSEADRWDAHLAAHGEGDAISRRIRAVRALEDAGAQVWPVAADVSDTSAMRAVIEAAEARFGTLCGVVHAAGIQAGGMIVLQDEGRAEESFAPKIGGARALRELLVGRTPDFVVLCSSLNSVKGFPGVADYSAANAYLDVFARQFANETGIHTVSLGWNRWREVGMAAEAHGGQLPVGWGISNAEGAEVFRRVLAHRGDPRLLVSEFDLWTVLDSTEDATRATEVEGALEELGELHARPDLSSAYAEPGTATEKELAAIWRMLFAIDGIGIHDNFFDLGGHSLLATRLLNQLHHTHPGAALSLKAIFENPTIAQLAQRIETTAEMPPPEPRMQRRVDPAADVEQMSDNEVDALLKSMLEEERSAEDGA